MSDLIRREDALALRDKLADIIGALPMSSIYSALSEYRNAIRALPAVQPGKEVMPDVEDTQHTQPDAAPAGNLTAGGGAGQMADTPMITGLVASNLTAGAEPTAVQPKVKPLVWEGAEGEDITAQPDRFHTYVVRKLSEKIFDVILSHELGSLWFRQSRNEVWPDYTTAKAAAQADYEARILSALEPAVQPDAHVNETPKSEHDTANMLTPATKGGDA